MTKTIASISSGPTVFAMIAFGFVALTSRVKGQECSQAVELQKAQVLQKLGPGIKLHRREDLEDNLLQVSPKDPQHLEPPILVYEVQDARFAVVKDEVLLADCNDGCSRQQYVAIARDGTHAYWLFGFDHPDVAFKALSTDAKVSVESSASADVLGATCAELVAGVRPERWVLSAASAQSMAGAFFLSKDAKNGLKRAAQWWRAYDRDNPGKTQMRLNGAPKEGFRLTIPIFQARNNTASIAMLEANMGKTGACTVSIR